MQDVTCGNERIIFSIVKVALVAAPGIVFGLGDEVGGDRVKMDVFADFDLVDWVFDWLLAIPPLEKVASIVVFSVHVNGVNGIDMVHDTADVCLGGFDLEVRVVGHEAVCM